MRSFGGNVEQHKQGIDAHRTPEETKEANSSSLRLVSRGLLGFFLLGSAVNGSGACFLLGLCGFFALELLIPPTSTFGS